MFFWLLEQIATDAPSFRSSSAQANPRPLLDAATAAADHALDVVTAEATQQFWMTRLAEQAAD